MFDFNMVYKLAFTWICTCTGFPGQIPQSRKTVVCVCVLDLHLSFVTVWYIISGMMSYNICADPEEFLNSLLQQTLKADPLIHLR